MIHLHLSHQNFYSPPQSHLIFFRTYQLFVTYRGGGGILWWGGGGGEVEGTFLFESPNCYWAFP